MNGGIEGNHETEILCEMDLGYTTEFFLVQPYGGEEGSA